MQVALAEDGQDDEGVAEHGGHGKQRQEDEQSDLVALQRVDASHEGGLGGVAQRGIEAAIAKAEVHVEDGRVLFGGRCCAADGRRCGCGCVVQGLVVEGDL